MDQPTPTLPTRLDRFRLWVKSAAGRIFAAPYLPPALTVCFGVTVVTNLALVLMSQPFSYWDGAPAQGWTSSGGRCPMDPPC